MTHDLTHFWGTYNRLGLHVLRGIVLNWKQPIIYNLDSPMTKDHLIPIIIAAEAHCIQIHNIVYNLRNQSLLKCSVDCTIKVVQL